ncbi:dihydrolipoyl dehydrogenase [Brevibacillus sp. AF8]|uniref:dihydrolipoyl dehydrogenase n=1 Tax=Brevibacillus sp. AF8 TaxID=2825881 RepID=UPI001E5009A9|nr:dihydrolipoyl dehydrogenase [Brevibacillus sp. AF8]MCE0448576.1 dihydrolipoyl dehydrogenase [Brevibacillus sp. AF8]
MSTIAVIGGGPAGYVAAIAAAKKGKQVTLIEQRVLGGTCLNEGCMPTKSLLESAEMAEKIKHAGRFGIRVPEREVSIDWPGVQSYKNNIVQQLVMGIGFLMRKNKIKVLTGKARFVSQRQIAVENDQGEEIVEADKIIIASGSEPIELPFAPFDGRWIIHSGHAMSLSAVPETLLIIGGGVIGCEFASIYSRMGCDVTVIEMADQLLPGEDADIAGVLHDQLERTGVKILTSTSLTSVDQQTKTVRFKNPDGSGEVAAEIVLVAVGRIPRTAELQLDRAGVAFGKQGIFVNGHMQTNVPHIYACGDVVGGIQLAHVAFHEGTVAALHACGLDAKANYRAVPRCIYTSPEIAGVGLTEKQARSQYGDVRIGEFSFSVNGKAMILGEAIGKVKVITEPEYNEILGVSIVGPRATELIGQGTVMIHGEMTADMMETFISAHPTLSEAVHEALLSAIGHALHA